VLLADVSELSIGSIFIGRWIKMEPIENSETSASNTQTPGIYPKESELHSYILFIIIIGGILVLYIYITRLASNEIF
jgi:hypothetical protein